MRWASCRIPAQSPHSILDDSVTQYLRLSVDASPTDWETTLLERKLSLSEYKRHGTYDAALHQVLDKYTREIEQKSLVERIKLLNTKCQPMLLADYPPG